MSNGKNLNAEYFLEAVYQALLEGPSSVGRRLKPERELAQMFELSRPKVSRSIQALVDQGILVRQHGSGVFVRKVPNLSEPMAFSAKSYPAVFVEEKGATRINPPKSKLRLKLELWWRQSPPGPTTRTVHRGITDQIKELGHELRLHRIPAEESDAALRRRLKMMRNETPCDGRIVLAQFASSFQSDKSGQVPTVYVWTSDAGHALQPLVQVAQAEAVSRALNILVESGRSRIGLLGLDNRVDVVRGPMKSQEKILRPIYDQVLWGLSHSFRAAEFSLTDQVSVSKAVSSLINAGVDALVVADDIVFNAVVEECTQRRIPLGHEIAVIVLSNRGTPLAGKVDWSRLEFDPYSTGRLAVTSLVRDIESAGDELLSFSHNATWRPGVSHLNGAVGDREAAVMKKPQDSLTGR